jgi:hypothetical protein
LHGLRAGIVVSCSQAQRASPEASASTALLLHCMPPASRIHPRPPAGCCGAREAAEAGTRCRRADQERVDHEDPEQIPPRRPQ